MRPLNTETVAYSCALHFQNFYVCACNTGNVHSKLAAGQLLEAIENYFSFKLRSEETKLTLARMLRKKTKVSTPRTRK